MLFAFDNGDAEVDILDLDDFSATDTILPEADFVLSAFYGASRHPVTGEIYVVVDNGARALGTFDPVCEHVESIGNLGDQVSGLAFDDAGTLYAIVGDGGTAAEDLHTVDLDDGTLTFYEDFAGGDFGEAIAFNPNTSLLHRWSGDSNVRYQSYDPVGMVTTTIILSEDTSEVTGATWHEARGGFVTHDLSGRIWLHETNGQVSMLSNGSDANFNYRGFVFAPRD